MSTLLCLILLAHLHTDLVYVGDIRAALAEPEATEEGK